MRELLGGLPVFAGVLDDFDTTAVPDAPHELFAQWLREAVEAGVREPHAMTLSTAGPDGPDARVLIVKDVDARGWSFASSTASAKGLQLAERPTVALTFYWPDVARQVRVRGVASPAPSEESAADFLARGLARRAVTVASTPSRALRDRDTLMDAIGVAESRLKVDPSYVEPTWTVYLVRPRSVEFWQADKDRAHVRLRYDPHGNGWKRGLLWP